MMGFGPVYPEQNEPLFHAPWEGEALEAAIEAELALPGARAWALSNHDFPRLPDRYGEDATRDAAQLVCSLPGIAFLYQGDEISKKGDGGPTCLTRPLLRD